MPQAIPVQYDLIWLVWILLMEEVDEQTPLLKMLQNKNLNH